MKYRTEGSGGHPDAQGGSGQGSGGSLARLILRDPGALIKFGSTVGVPAGFCEVWREGARPEVRLQVSPAQPLSGTRLPRLQRRSRPGRGTGGAARPPALVAAAGRPRRGDARAPRPPRARSPCHPAARAPRGRRDPPRPAPSPPALYLEPAGAGRCCRLNEAGPGPRCRARREAGRGQGRAGGGDRLRP